MKLSKILQIGFSRGSWKFLTFPSVFSFSCVVWLFFFYWWSSKATLEEHSKEQWSHVPIVSSNSKASEVKPLSQNCIKGESQGFFKIEFLISNGFDSKLLLQIATDLWEMVETHFSWHSEWCPNIVLFISKEIMFIRYKEMKISKEKLKSSEKLEKRFFDESSAYCCKSEDSSRLTANFEAKYFCKKSKYDWEKIFE